GALEVEVELLVPDRFGRLLDGHGPEGAGVVDEDVDGAERADDLAHHMIDLGKLAAVRLEGLCHAASCRDAPDHGVCRGVVPVIDDGDPGAFGCIANGDSLADAL